MNRRVALVLRIFVALLICLSLSNCESDADRKLRLQKEKKERLQQELRKQIKLEELAFQREQDSIEEANYLKEEEEKRKEQLEKDRKEKEIYDKYIGNSLYTGATPYKYCFGGKNSCKSYSCSQIKVKTPYNSEVLVTIKQNNKVVRHAYINSSSSFTFNFPDGIYQVFFYYGKGWNPNKIMTKTTCGILKGGFIDNEHFGKDNPQALSSSILTYELILQKDGNFSTRPSNSGEAF